MTTEEYGRAAEESRLALVPLVERVQSYTKKLPRIRRVYRLRYMASHRAMKSNSNCTTEQSQIFRASAWKLHESLSSKASQFIAEFDGLRREVESLVPKLRIVLPAHEIDSLAGKFHPAAIESACEEILRLEARLEEFLPSRPQPGKRRHGPKPDMNRHRTIAEIVSPYGERWNEPANSRTIADKLDQLNVATPKGWRQSWTDCRDSLPDRFTKAVTYSVKMNSRSANSR